MIMAFFLSIIWAFILIKGIALLIEDFAFAIAFMATAVCVIIGAIIYILTHQ